MIGLVDLDLQQSTSLSTFIPNVEIMKLATYYKIEENHFCRLINLNETELSQYDKIYVFSESKTLPQVPEAFLRAKNVIFGGTAFTNGIYVPFKNEIIDYTIPRPAIYKEFLKQKYNEGMKTKDIGHVLDDSYYRNYAGENELPIPPIKRNKRIYLYDKDFFYDDWQDTIETISERHCSSIIRIHPIVCNKVSQFFEVRSFQKINRNNEIILDFEIPVSELDYLFKHYKNKFLAEIVKNSMVFLPLGGTLKTNLQYARDIDYKLYLLFYFWHNDIPMKIKFEEPKLGTTNPFYELDKMIEMWSLGCTKNDYGKNLLEKIPKKKSYDYLREQYDLLIKYAPAAGKLFNYNYEEIKEGVQWKI